MISNFIANIREALASLPPAVRTAWLWDIATGGLAGIYQGCIWTFVMKVARADMKASGAQIAWITAAPALGYLFATFWARQMEGRSKMPFVKWTWFFARGSFMLAPLIASTTHYVALVCLTPILFSVSMPAYTAIIKDIYPDKHRGRLMSYARILLSILTLIASLIMGRLMDHGLNYRIAFGIGGIFGALSAWTFSRIHIPIPEPADSPATTKEFFKDTLGILSRNPGFRWFSASVFVSGFGNIVATTLYPMYQVDKFHITNTQVANMQNIASAVTIVGFFFWGGFLDRRGPLTTVLIALLFNLAAPLLYAVAWNITALYMAAAMMGLAIGGIDLGYLNTTLRFAEPGKVAQYQALHSSFFGVRGTIAPQFAIPLMHTTGARNTFIISFLVIVVGVLLQIISMRDYRRSD